MVADHTSPATRGEARSPSPHSPLPIPHSPLSPLDRALLTRLFERSSLPDLFDSLKDQPIPSAPTSLFELTEWAHQDHIKPWIDIRAAQHRESEQRDMIALLKEIARTSDNKVERRRAATTILRALNPYLAPIRPARRPPSSDSGPRTQDQGLSSPPRPRGTPKVTPSPSLSNYDAAEAISCALLEPDDPDQLATIESLAAPNCTIQNQPITDLQAQVRALKHRGTISNIAGPFQKSDQLNDPSANFCHLEAMYNKQPTRCLLSFIRSPNGPNPNAWLLTALKSHNTS